MPDDLSPQPPGRALRPINAGEPLASPPRDTITLKEADPQKEDISPAERTFETKATRIRLTDDEHDELARRLETILNAIQTERDERELDANWDLWEDLYFGVLQDRPAGQANVHVPIAQEVVDTALAVVEQSFFTARPWLQVQPREPMDVATAKRKEQFLDYANTVEMLAKEKLDPILWESAALGTGVEYLPWLRETDRIRDEETYDGLSIADMERFVERYPDANKDYPEVVARLKKGEKVTLTVEYNEARQDAPEPTYIPLRDWLVRPAAKWHQLHRERFVGHWFSLRYAQIEELTEDSYYDDRLQRLAFRWEEDGTFKDDPTYRDEQYKIATGILRWKRPGDVRERRYLVDFHRESRTVLRVLHYPYWHNRPNYIPWYFQRSRRGIYGISLIQKVEQSQFEANAAHSLVLDHLSFSLPMYKARKGTESNFNPMRDGMYAGKVWYFDNPESDAQQFQTALNSAVTVALNIEDRAARHGELASGASQNLSGLESARDPDAPGNKTAALIHQAHVRINKYLATLGWSLSEHGFQTCELYYQFSPKGRQFRVMGAEGSPVFEQITRQELRLRADYYPHGTTAALNPEREKREVFEMGAQLLKSPDVNQSALKRWAIIEMMLDVAGDVWAKQKSKVLPSAEEMQVLKQEEEALLRQKQQALQAGAAGAPAQPQNGNVPPVGLPPVLPPQLAALLGVGNRLPPGVGGMG
jgi:hypothetical protein